MLQTCNNDYIHQLILYFVITHGYVQIVDFSDHCSVVFTLSVASVGKMVTVLMSTDTRYLWQNDDYDNYIDNVVKKVNDSKLGCYMKLVCTCILLYAGDILLVAPSVTSLQQLMHLCEQELDWLDMSLNVKKLACIRIGPRCNINCCNIVTREGRELVWINVVRYLEVYVESSSSFKCSLDSAKCSFYRSFNAVFGKNGRIASHEVIYS